MDTSSRHGETWPLSLPMGFPATCGVPPFPAAVQPFERQDGHRSDKKCGMFGCIPVPSLFTRG